MTDVEKVILELLKPHGFRILKPYKFTKQNIKQSSNNKIILIGRSTFAFNTSKIVEIVGTQVKLSHWNRIQWDITITNLYDPNSINLIEDWAKS